MSSRNQEPYDDEKYGEFLKTSATETFKLLGILILLMIAIPLFPAIIVILIAGGAFAGAERFLK